MSNVFTVSDILARGVVIEWHEGVALVREVAQRLFDGSQTAPSIPDLDQIHLSFAGRVDVRGGTVAQDPVRRVGQLLQAILTQSEPPVQLRLLISQATAPEPAFASISDYDRALEFFDRPNRSAVLEALFARAAAAPAPILPTVAPTVEAIAPLPIAEKRTAERETRTANRRKAALMAVAAVAMLACAAGLLYLRAAGVGPEAGRVADAALEASDTLGAAITTGLSAVSERAGLGRLVFANETSSPPAPVTAATPSNRPQTRRAAPVLRSSSGRSFAIFDVLSPAAGAATAPPSPLAGVRGEVIITELTVEEVEELYSTYSQDSAGVSPPVGVRPQFPRELPPDVDPSTLARIEMVILPDGTVESVKLLGEPRHVIDSMLLSAAKAWEFQPAMKDGRPVRYRKVVLMASQ